MATLNGQLCCGQQIYWLHMKSTGSCFMVYPRALSIVWGDTPKYWTWITEAESRDKMVELAELKAVCWLEVNGKFNTRKLAPRVQYEVSFVVMLEATASGWEVPVNLTLVYGGKKQEHKEDFGKKERNKWIEIPVGQFVASADGGKVEFSMNEHDDGHWKKGLVVKGVSIRQVPK